MTSHTYHPDVTTHGLAADCPRCQEHALHPEWMPEEDKRRIITAPLTALDHEARARLLQAEWGP